jgi:DNA-binding XRE family transcriptional regulator
MDTEASMRRQGMKKGKVRTFQNRLREDLKDPEFKTHYQEERQALKLAMKISKLREKKGLSQQQLAKLMGTSQQAISRIESGEYEGFTLKTLEKIAEATGTKVKIEFVAA